MTAARPDGDEPGLFFGLPEEHDECCSQRVAVARPEIGWFVMVTFAGVDHVSFTVSDLDRSQHFYTTVLGFVMVLDVGYGRIFMHPGTGFTLSLMKHEGAHGGDFTELTTGLDHLGLTATSRSDLEEWERRFDDLGVTYTPIRDMEFGYHLNFRDPDNIALELSAPNEHLIAAKKALADGQTSQADIDAFIDEHDLDLPRASTD